jgi:predicted signal transduction protein with EAL and GGDEF domain
MYQAKQAGGSRACLFSSDLNMQAEEILALDGDLRDALGRGELFLHFQPQSAPRGARLRGVEALVRWRHPRFGVLAPDRFIPVAETRGLIVELGRRGFRGLGARLRRRRGAGLNRRSGARGGKTARKAPRKAR